MRVGEGPLKVDFFGTTEITAAHRRTDGWRQPDINACILLRPAATPGTRAPLPSYDQMVIELGEPEPTVVTPADFRKTVRWRLKSLASQHGKSIPPDELESMVAEVERCALRESCQMELGENDPLIQKLRTVGQR
jgi:hypothetical protein